MMALSQGVFNKLLRRYHVVLRVYLQHNLTHIIGIIQTYLLGLKWYQDQIILSESATLRSQYTYNLKDLIADADLLIYGISSGSIKEAMRHRIPKNCNR